MIYSEFNDIRIAGIAAAVPEGIVEMESLKATDDPQMIDNFIKKTGIVRIHKGTFDQTAADYAFTAAKALQTAGKYSPEEIGVLIYITQCPDYRTPSTALALQKRLGLEKSCIVFDINLGCSGFVYGVSVGASLLNTSSAKKALVLVGDSLARKRRNIETKRKSNTTLLFGDASSAMLLEKSDGNKLCSALMSDGNGHKALSNPYQAWKHPEGPGGFPGDDIAVFNFTISEVPDLINAFLEKTGAEMSGFDSLILHQANKMIIKQIAKKVKMPMENVPISLDRYGNTSGASDALTIVDKYGESNEGKKIKLLVSGFGVGLSWGVLSFEIKDIDVLPVLISKDTYDDGYDDNLPEFDNEDV